jgi:hypothetical protein
MRSRFFHIPTSNLSSTLHSNEVLVRCLVSVEKQRGHTGCCISFHYRALILRTGTNYTGARRYCKTTVPRYPLLIPINLVPLASRPPPAPLPHPNHPPPIPHTPSTFHNTNKTPHSPQAPHVPHTSHNHPPYTPSSPSPTSPTQLADTGNTSTSYRTRSIDTPRHRVSLRTAYTLAPWHRAP